MWVTMLRRRKWRLYSHLHVGILVVTNSSQLRRFSTILSMWLENLSKTGRSHKQAVSVAVDSVIVIFSLWAAYSLRHGVLFSDFKSTLPVFLVLPFATVIVFMSMGIYRWVIRSSNRSLFKQLIKAAVISALFLVVFSFLFSGSHSMPRSVFVIYGLLLITGACGVRVVWQGIFDAGSRGEPVAIYGAGDAGRQLLHSLAQTSEYRAVLFLDDNQNLNGTTVAGVPVALVKDAEIDKILAGLEVEKIILAMPKLGATDYQEKVEALDISGLPVLTVPTYSELVSGSAKMSQVRDLSISDILGRTEVPANPELLGRCVTGKSVLVTGGGGSIGSELTRQIVLQNPSKLIVLDQSEFNLYQITEEITAMLCGIKGSATTFLPVLGSVTNVKQVSTLLEKEQVNTVYHAAAYKHVPVIEAQPAQGLDTNVFGTLNMVKAAIDKGVESFVLISTDKAVRPTNSMGASKRIAELILQAQSDVQSGTKISMVRFGNVLGSSGSVVPKFKQQIEQGGPITLTDPNITRYFMTIPEAAQLVLQASAIADGGDVFVLDMGEPVRIEDLATSMVRLSGKRLKRDTGLDSDIDIQIEGLRPGEKMYEELFITDSHQATAVQKVFTAQEEWIAWPQLRQELDTLTLVKESGDKAMLRSRLLSLAFLNLDAEKHAPAKLVTPTQTETVKDVESGNEVLSVDL